MENLFENYEALLYIKASRYPGIYSEEIDFLKIFCGLKASTGAVVISKNKSAVFVDGRYELAAKLEVDKKKFTIEPLSMKNVIQWIKGNLSENSRIIFDPKFFTFIEIIKLKNELNKYNFVEMDFEKKFRVKSFQRNYEIFSWDFEENKFFHIYETINQNNLDGYLVCEPCSTAWLMNMRDLKTENTPVLLGYLLITKNQEKIFYADDNYISSKFKPVNELTADLFSFKKIGADFYETPSFINCSNIVDIKNPVPEIKCRKTEAEIANIIEVTKEDSIALIDFMHWFYQNDNISELDCVNYLFGCRKKSKNFIGNSFDTIAAADEHSAIVHYSPSEKTNKRIEKFLLLDSGGQYKFGTTDITRTLSKVKPSSEEKLYYTLVLKGHLEVANAQFKKGETGSSIDALARKYLREYSLDYNHSTGHGIGYMLGVHEGPISISPKSKVPLSANMLLSNEPGVYMENHLGVRLENMMITREKNDSIFFETISLVPFDNKFIDFSLLNGIEKSQLKNYNEKITSNLNLPKHLFDWLISYIKISV